MSRRARSLRLHAISSALLAAIVAAFAVSPARAQAPKQVVPFEGTQVFRQLLSHAKLKPLAGSADLDNTDPKDVIVIYLGAMASGRVDGFDHGLKEFVDKGGAVLVASEHWDFGALNRFGITLNPNRIVDNNDRYAENRECPLVADAGAPAHRAFKDLGPGIATNRPIYLRSTQLPVFAYYSHTAFPERERIRIGRYAFAAGTPDPPPDAGRILVLAGYGQFTNGMMLRLDNDNFTFAWNTIRWLRESEGGRTRQYALLLEDGKVVDKFEGPLMITLPQVSLANLLNHAIDRLERNDALNRWLARSLPREWLLRGVVIFVTVLLVFFGRRWLARGRHRLETDAPLVDLTVEGMLAELPPLSRRHRAMLVSGNFYDAARALARHFFESHLGHETLAATAAPISAATAAPISAATAAPTLPPLEVGAGWSSGLRADLEWLWNLAYGPAPMAVSSTRLARVVRACHVLDAAFADGTLLFHPPPARKMVPPLAQSSKLE